MDRDCVEKMVREEFEKGSDMMEAIIDLVTDKIMEIYEACKDE